MTKNRFQKVYLKYNYHCDLSIEHGMYRAKQGK